MFGMLLFPDGFLPDFPGQWTDQIVELCTQGRKLSLLTVFSLGIITSDIIPLNMV